MTSVSRSPQWGTRIEIKSESSSRVYVVAEKLDQGRPTGTYGCSCPGWKSRRNCKHLAGMRLASCAAPITPAARGLGAGDGRSFTDAAYKHYDVSREGFGGPEEWFRLAEEMARGRKRYAPPPRSRFTSAHAGDMRLLGLAEMPLDVRDLVRAMRKQARVLHPDFGGTSESFTAMFMAYERLLLRYPR